MKYNLPIEVVRGRKPIITQEFGNMSNNAWYAANGIDTAIGHNGTDIVISGGAIATYGTRLVCPVPKALLNKVWYTEPLATKGNGVKVQWNDERGVVKMTVWHCSETFYREEYQEKDTLGFIGNSGLVRPAPTYSSVHAGAHLHLMTYVNEVLVNPREIFDFNKWYISDKDTGIVKDLPPFQYFINKIAEALKNM